MKKQTEEGVELGCFRWHVSGQVFELEEVNAVGAVTPPQTLVAGQIALHVVAQDVGTAAGRVPAPGQVGPRRHDAARVAHQHHQAQAVVGVGQPLHQVAGGRHR